jgi:hypothetical protein
MATDPFLPDDLQPAAPWGDEQVTTRRVFSLKVEPGVPFQMPTHAAIQSVEALDGGSFRVILVLP